MAEQTFRLLQNSFESQTRQSHKKAVSLSTDTTDKLRVTVPAPLQAIYNAYLPFHDAYIALNLSVELAEGTYKGKTLSFENILDTISEKLRLWEPPIRVIFPEDSPTEVEIFPNKREPFYDGTYEQRLLAVKALRDKLLEYTGANPSLVPVQADVAAFYTLANTARQTQQGNEGSLSALRTQREAQRKTTMGAFWGTVYGGLLGLYYLTPELIADYIDLPLLYDYKTEELIDTLNVPGQVVANLPLTDITVTASTRFRIKNMTEGAAGHLVVAYFASTNVAGPGDPPTGIVFNPGDNRLETAEDLGWTPAKPFLNFYAPGPDPLIVEVWEVR